MIVASAACLAVSQFVDYRAVEVGQPGYAGLPAATPPTVGIEPAGQPHLYLLLPVALLAAALAGLALRTGARRLGRFVFALGLLSLAVILLVDLPAGLDAAARAGRRGSRGRTRRARRRLLRRAAAARGLMLGGGAARRPRRRAASATMRGRAEHEPANPQGPQAP